MADDENLGKDFKKAVSELTKANKELKSANEKLVERGGLAEAGKEIHKTWTSTWTGMKDTLVGSLGPVGKIGESLISGIIGKSKQKKEEELLAKQLGIGVEEMRAMAKQKQILDAQEEAQKKFEAAAEAMGIPDDVWKNTIDHQTQMAEVAIGKLTGDADFVQNQQDKQWVANLDKKAAEEKANIEERHKKELEVAKSAEISEENLRKLEDQHIQELANADKKLIDEKERMAAEGEKGFKTQEEFLAEQKKNAELSDAEAEQRAQDLYNTQVGIITEGEKEEKTDDPQTKAAEESLKTVQDFYKELREDMTVPATEAWAQAKELFTKQNAAVEEQKKTTELEKETAEKGADVVDAQKELDTELKKLTDQVNMGLITQEQFTKAQQKATEEFAAQEAAAAAKKEEVKTDVSDGGTERIEDTAEAFAAAIAEQAQRSADTPDPKPEVIPTNGKGDLDAKALEELARKQLEEQAEFNKMAGKAGSIFVHDTSVEDAIADQNKQGGAAAQEVANEQRRKDDKLIDTLDEIAENTEGGGGAGAGAGGGGDGGGGGKFGGIGGGIANIGKGLGKGLGGILRGIAQGLIFWANPLVPLGAAALAAAIAVIGAGIAGATWIVGKALPTFAEGMKSFEDLDGDKLVSAGKGMAAVAGGMAAFGVGTAVAGLGSLVGGITSGIVGLFGGDDPLTKMEKFQAYDFDEVKIKSNAAAMVAYSTGMAALGGATALAGVGLAIGAVGGAIAGLFGAENPLDKMLKFQAYTFDTEKSSQRCHNWITRRRHRSIRPHEEVW